MIWLGLALFSTSWLLSLGYYYPANWRLWLAMVAGGVVCMLGAPRIALQPRGSVIAMMAMVTPALVVLPEPYRIAAALLFAGLLVQLLLSYSAAILRWTSILDRISTAALLSGFVLLLQSLAMRSYTEFTARTHELFTPLPQLLGVVARAMGIDSARDGNAIALHSMRQIHLLGTTWELLLDPVTFCFLCGSIGIFAWFAFHGVWQRKQLTTAFVLFIAGLLVWLPVRSGLLMGLYLHDVLRTDYENKLDAMKIFWNTWVHLLLLVGPLVICCFFLPQINHETAHRASITQPHFSSRRNTFVAALCMFLAAALLTFGTLWDPIGARQAGRVLVEEYHPQPEKLWEPTAIPFDTEWYGPKAGYNYYCIYDYCSRFYTMSRSTAPLNSSMLRDCDVLLVKVPTRPYSQREIAAIRNFVRRGGGLLLIGEHTNVYRTSDYLNPIARTFGFEFREDCLFGIDSVFEQKYEPPLVPHPIVQHLEQMDFATSCSIDPGFSKGQAVIRDTGLKNLLADYHSDNYYPLPEDQAEMRYGAFVQLWATRFGKGRVVAFTDSTIFSNFCTFDPGKAELMLNMIGWLNHRGSNLPYSSVLLVLGSLCLGAASWFAVTMRCSLLVLISAGLLGWTASVATLREIHAMPVPQPTRDLVRVTIDRTICDAPLSRNGFVDGTANGFGIFERWLLRIGYFTSRRKIPAAFASDLVVFVRPVGNVDPSMLGQLTDYVREGGRVLVLDSARNHSTTNALLKPFRLSVDHQRPLRGVLRCENAWPEVPVKQAIAVQGGQPIAWINSEPVGATTNFGKGTVTVIGLADRFSDAQMGFTGDVVPDRALRAVYDLHFQFFRWIIRPESLD